MEQRDTVQLDPTLVITELRNQLSDAMFENVKLKAFIMQMQNEAKEAPPE